MDKKRTDVNELGEFGLIDHLTKQNNLLNESSFFGIGDDAAVIGDGDRVTLISTDSLVEGIHFDLTYAPLKHLGYKAVSVNVSDIYAMNGKPEQITVSIAFSNRFSVEALEELYEGIYAACDYYNVDLVGGDTTSAPKGLFINITAIGTAKKEEVVYRSGAKPGDVLCCTGNLGAAYIGLLLLEREKHIFLEHPTVQPKFDGKKYVIGRQLKPDARKDIYERLKKTRLIPTSMIDISDGLASELFHICKASGVGVVVEEAHVPINPETYHTAIDLKIDPITCALSGGEDYELLFTIDQKDVELVRFLPDIFLIGDIVEKKDGVKIHTKGGNIHELKAQGWKHF